MSVQRVWHSALARNPLRPGSDRPSTPSCSVSAGLRADAVIGIDLGTTNSCVATMDGKVWFVWCCALLRACQCASAGAKALLALNLTFATPGTHHRRRA